MSTYQSVSKNDRIVTIPHLECATRSLAAAELLHREGYHADAACRAHQSTIHSERALLATEMRSPTSVRTVHRLAEQHFVKPGQVDPAFLSRLTSLGALRASIDEQPAGHADPEDAERAIATARDFLGATEDWLREHEFIGDAT